MLPKQPSIRNSFYSKGLDQQLLRYLCCFILGAPSLSQQNHIILPAYVLVRLLSTVIHLRNTVVHFRNTLITV
jgi:hypothetical protein